MGVRCEIPLAKPIVLATQTDTDYTPLQWSLTTGDHALLRMDVDQAAAKTHYSQHSSTPNYFVNTRVEKLFLLLTVKNVTPTDISRLLGTNRSEETHHAHLKTASRTQDYDYQSGEALGQRVAKDIREAANTLLRFVRINYGQYWLTFVGAQDSELQNFLDSLKAEWTQGGTDLDTSAGFATCHDHSWRFHRRNAPVPRAQG